MEWINVENGMPADGSNVLVWIGGTAQEPIVAQWYCGAWADTMTFDEINEVTHWMPLPPAPSVLQPVPLAQKPNEQSIASAYESVERSEYASRDDANA